MLFISVDGACRRNGQPDCISAGGVFIQEVKDNEIIAFSNLSEYETHSTSQRGELTALATALAYVLERRQESLIVMDSEYMFNTMTKEWYVGWQRNGWLTAQGTAVKNKDLWLKISSLYNKCDESGIPVTFFHIKGHCIPFGKVTAKKLLAEDPTSETLYKAVLEKYIQLLHTEKTASILKDANELSKKNNGFSLSDNTLERFVVSNVVVDAIANRCVEAANSLL